MSYYARVSAWEQPLLLQRFRAQKTGKLKERRRARYFQTRPNTDARQKVDGDLRGRIAPDEALAAGDTLCIPKGNNEAWRNHTRKDRLAFIRYQYKTR